MGTQCFSACVISLWILGIVQFITSRNFSFPASWFCTSYWSLTVFMCRLVFLKTLQGILCADSWTLSPCSFWTSNYSVLLVLDSLVSLKVGLWLFSCVSLLGFPLCSVLCQWSPGRKLRQSQGPLWVQCLRDHSPAPPWPKCLRHFVQFSIYLWMEGKTHRN